MKDVCLLLYGIWNVVHALNCHIPLIMRLIVSAREDFQIEDCCVRIYIMRSICVCLLKRFACVYDVA